MFEEIDISTCARNRSGIHELAARLRALPTGKAIKVTCADMGWKDRSALSWRSSLRTAMVRLGVNVATSNVGGVIVIWEKRQPVIEDDTERSRR